MFGTELAMVLFMIAFTEEAIMTYKTLFTVTMMVVDVILFASLVSHV